MHNPVASAANYQRSASQGLSIMIQCDLPRGQKSFTSESRTAGKPLMRDDVSQTDGDVDMAECEKAETDVSTSVGLRRLTGHFARLPIEILEDILARCRAKELACLEATCAYFLATGITERMAKDRLQEIPRAKGLQPRTERNERWLHLYHFVMSQSSAAAQSTAVSSGAYHTSALLIPDPPKKGDEDRHCIFTFGRGFHGQLGCSFEDDQESKNAHLPRDVSLGYLKLSDDPTREEEVMPAVVSCGASHTISISRKGTLYGWGLDIDGQLGTGCAVTFTPCKIPLSNRRVVSVGAGSKHTLVITETGELWTCGSDCHGQLGHGYFHDTRRLSRVEALKQGLRIVSAAAGDYHSLALATDGSLFSWGSTEYGQLGHPYLEHQGAMVPLSLPTPQPVEDLNPRKLAPQDRVTSISAGGNHTVALTVSGNLLVFGDNRYGQLGLGDKRLRWKPTQLNVAAGFHSGNSTRVVQVVCGSKHTIVLALHWTKMQVLATGSNYWGQIGSRDTSDSLNLVPIQSLAHQPIVSVQSGSDHCCAVSKYGKVFLWGRGDCGQLGTGNDRSRKMAIELEGFRLVHPDRTLRRANRCKPRIRPIIQKKASASKTPIAFRPAP